VRVASVLSTAAKMKSFQASSNVRMVAATNPGRTSGSTT
jgi:hypothetical protein